MILQKSTAENNTYNTHQMGEVSTYLILNRNNVRPNCC